MQRPPGRRQRLEECLSTRLDLTLPLLFFFPLAGRLRRAPSQRRPHRPVDVLDREAIPTLLESRAVAGRRGLVREHVLQTPEPDAVRRRHLQGLVDVCDSRPPAGAPPRVQPRQHREVQVFGAGTLEQRLPAGRALLLGRLVLPQSLFNVVDQLLRRRQGGWRGTPAWLLTQILLRFLQEPRTRFAPR